MNGTAVDVLPVLVVLTVLGLAVVAGILYRRMVRRLAIDLLPIARSALLDELPDPVLVLDALGNVVVSNRAAAALMAGQGALLAELPVLNQVLARSAAPIQDVVIGTRHYEVSPVPLKLRNRPVGRLLLLHDISHRRSMELRLHAALRALEEQLSSNIKLQQSLREQATLDPLTGLYNRRFLDEIHPTLTAEAKGAGHCLAAAMIDLDHFKRFNDTAGHDAGDAVLRAIGAFLLKRVRQDDFVFRLGGEELLVLLRGPQGPQALARIDDWRAEFAALSINGLSATFSAGIAVYPEDADDFDGLCRRADRALYRAKAEGRNRVCRWQAEEAEGT